ncbi:MAG: ttuB, partial [Polaromonas sp.]|nr:ttuB [Polaromonas sp.]
FVALMFFINYLDRTAISFAGPNGMNTDLALSAAQFGFASGVFFIGYILLEVPSNLALHKFGARRWLARIMVSWGVVSLLFTWVGNMEQLYILRFILGVAEAGFFPGAILFLSLWVPSRHRSKILALFYLADSPAKAKWLTQEEKTWLTGALEKEKKETAASNKHVSVRTVFGNGRVWMLSAIYFGFIYGLYALGFFLPTIIAGFEGIYGTKFDVFQKGMITAVPYLPAAFALYFWSKDATKRGVKTWHIALPALIGGLSIPLALFAGSPAATIAVITITAMSIFAALPNFWTVPTQFLTGAAAAAGIALINTIGNLAGFSAGYVTGWLKDLTGGYTVPMFVVGGFMLLSSILMVVLSRSGKVSEGIPAEALDPTGAGHHAEP